MPAVRIAEGDRSVRCSIQQDEGEAVRRYANTVGAYTVSGTRQTVIGTALNRCRTMMRTEQKASLVAPSTCPKCGGTMHVTRRTPHPVIIKGEKQTLTCQSCGAQDCRSIDEDGTVIV